jgi:hypothetical protein
MLKEERELRRVIRFRADRYHEVPKLITALVKAVREEDAKLADNAARSFAEFAEHAKKRGHNVDDIVARRIACEDVAVAIRKGRK